MQIIHGDCLEEMRKMGANSIDCIVTDPPYGLHFMGKDWDKFSRAIAPEEKVVVPALRKSRVTKIMDSGTLAGTYSDDCNDEFQSFIHSVALEALRIAKPGAHLLMFGAPRRYHRQVCALEDAGWQIRDCLMWLFGSGFPKSHNFGRQLGGEWTGFGTALKPAYEPIIRAMKPLDGTFAQNAEKWGVAGINVDASRIGSEVTHGSGSLQSFQKWKEQDGRESKDIVKRANTTNVGRWPANILFDEEAAAQLDEQSGISKSSIRPPTIGLKKSQGRYGDYYDIGYERGINDSGGASRFFYCAKTSASERNAGLEQLPPSKDPSGVGALRDNGRDRAAANNHPTVKPLALMEYLIRLIAPPKDGLLLDPFAGSGSTLVAAHRAGIRAIGIEKSAEYCEIARARIKAA